MKYVPVQIAWFAIAISILGSVGCSSGFEASSASKSSEAIDSQGDDQTPAPTVVAGLCGSVNGAALTSAPAANLCSTGTASTVTGTGPYIWSCAGINGGATANCSAQRLGLPVSGQCGSANGTTVAAAPMANLCSVGTASMVTGGGPYNWTCAGANGGANATCSAQRAVAPPTPVAGMCGSANGVSVSTAPSANLCLVGTASTVTGSGPFTWSCAGMNGGANATCSAPRSVVQPAPPTGSKCGMQTATGPLAFCETFDRPSTPFNRSGQLDGLVWGVSRSLTQPNLGRPWPWATGQLNACGNLMTVTSSNDIQICNGQLRQATKDNMDQGAGGSPSAMTLYPKQQFDFSGRVGTVAFDVSNDTAGMHAAWPEFWMSDHPVPAPFNHFGSWLQVPANGFGIRFGAMARPNEYGACGSVENSYRFTVDSAVIVRDWILDDTGLCDSAGACRRSNMNVEIKGCVRSPNGPNDGLNHIELKVSQNQIDVYATDAGTTSPLKLIAVITNANLSFSRGFVWLEDVHYNAEKGDESKPLQISHTFAWDNVAFDGPLVARERSLDVLESKIPTPGGQYLGWSTTPQQPARLETIAIPAADILAARTGALLFNFYHYDAPRTFTYKINGVTYNATWPYPERQGFTARTISLPVPLTALKMGANQIEINADVGMEVTNVSISLQGAGGIVAPN